MKEKITARLASLEAEHAKGIEALKNLEQQLAQLHSGLANIAGAILVCKEFLEDAPAE